MRLKFANYPPLLSHLLIFVFGMGVHNIFTPARQQERVKLRPQRVYIVVPKKMQLYSKIRTRQQVAFVIKKPTQPNCAMLVKGARLQHRYHKTLLIALTVKQSTNVIYHMQHKTLEGVFAVGDPRGLELKSCSLKPVVKYGMH